MQITAKTAKVKERKNAVVGFATVYFKDDADFSFAVRNIQIMKSGKTKELFLAFPTKKDSTAEDGYADVAFPLNKETRVQITRVVLDEFNRMQQQQDALAHTGA